MQQIRCGWVKTSNELYVRYHDKEWGIPVHDDRILFEFLILEGAQAGLSWETVIKKREHYKKVFFDFDVKKCSELSDSELEDILKDESIIRNRLKVFSVRKNALVYIQIQQGF
jgi:DNA-3-methyladenine glycosylase I